MKKNFPMVRDSFPTFVAQRFFILVYPRNSDCHVVFPCGLELAGCDKVVYTYGKNDISSGYEIVAKAEIYRQLNTYREWRDMT